MHLYFKMKATCASQQPPTIRILKHLLSMEDPLERKMGLEAAFTPGPDLTEDPEQDHLHTTPENMAAAIKFILETYRSNSKSAQLSEVASLMNPDVIERLEEIELEIEQNYKQMETQRFTEVQSFEM